MTWSLVTNGSDTVGVVSIDGTQGRPTPRVALEALYERLKDQGLDSSISAPGEFLQGGRLRVSIPNGRNQRVVVFNGRSAMEMLGPELGALPFDLAQVVFLGDYAAFADRSTGRIEALVSGVSSIGPGSVESQLGRIAALARTGGAGGDALSGADTLADAGDGTDLAGWEMVFDMGGIRLELSRSSNLGSQLLRGGRSGVTLKIDGAAVATHDAARSALEDWANSLFFDFSVSYDVPLRIPVLNRVRPLERARRRRGAAPSAPRNFYEREPVQLYTYARTTRDLPLQEFLAYYQVLEFFFDRAVREDVIRSVRTAIARPQFDHHDDRQIADIIARAAPAAKVSLSEREQLRVTVRSAVTAADLRELVEVLDEQEEHFTARKQRIGGLSALNLNSSALHDEVADRIYALRCRIVHTKDSGASRSAGILLPTSEEARHLSLEMPLIRHIAEEAILSRSRPIAR